MADNKTIWIIVIIVAVLIVSQLDGFGLFAVSFDTYNTQSVCNQKIYNFDITNHQNYGITYNNIYGLVGAETSLVYQWGANCPGECRDDDYDSYSIDLRNRLKIGGFDASCAGTDYYKNKYIVGISRSGERDCYAYHLDDNTCYLSYKSIKDYLCVYDSNSFGDTYRLAKKIYDVKDGAIKLGEATKYEQSPCPSGSACVLGTTNGVCIYPECSSNSQCGSNTWVSSDYCSQDDDVWNIYRTWNCVNDGTPDAYCEYSELEKLKQDCEIYGCENGVCKTCTDECTSGQTTCDGQYKQTCGDYDTDDCLEWGNDYDCGVTTYGDYEDYYCKDENTQARDRTVIERGCSSGGCILNEYSEPETITCDTLGCDYITGKCTTITCQQTEVLQDGVCYDKYDTDFSGNIDRTELGNQIKDWITDPITTLINNVRLRIIKWKEYILSLGGN